MAANIFIRAATDSDHDTMYLVFFVLGLGFVHLVRTIVMMRTKLRDCRAVKRFVRFLCLSPC